MINVLDGKHKNMTASQNEETNIYKVRSVYRLWRIEIVLSVEKRIEKGYKRSGRELYGRKRKMNE